MRISYATMGGVDSDAGDFEDVILKHCFAVRRVEVSAFLETCESWHEYAIEDSPVFTDARDK